MTSPSEPAVGRSRGKSVLRLLAIAAGILVAFAVGLGIGLHTPWGMKAAVNLALQLGRPPGTELSVAGARGGLLSGIELHGIRLTRLDGSLSARVDTLIVRYRLHELIGTSQRVREIVVAGAHVTTRLPDGPFDAGKPVTEPRPKDFALDRLSVRRADARLHMHAVGRDSLLEVEGLELAISDLRVTETASLTLDTLTAVLRAPAAPAATLRLAMAAEVTPGLLRLKTLTLDGGRTRVDGGGTLPIPTPKGIHFEGADFRLQFAPLAGSDIERFLPALGNPGDVALDLVARGESSALHATLTARAQRGGHVNLEARVPAPGGSMSLRTEGSVRDLDLGAILGGAPDSLVIGARWSADIAGADSARISGPFALDLAGTRAGKVHLERARVAGRFENGRATIQMDGAAEGVALAASGWASPLGKPVAFDLSGSFSVPPVRATAGGPVLFAGETPFRVHGRGTSADSASVAASVEFRPGAPATQLLGPGRFTAGLDAGVARWRLELAVASGTVRAEGEVHLAQVPSFRVRSGAVEGVDIAAFAGDTTGSRLDARFSAEGRGTQSASLRATAEVASLSLAYGPHEIRDASASFKLDDGRAHLEVDALIDRAAVKARASIASLSQPREVQVGLAFRDLDLARVVGDTLLGSRIAGRLEARFTGPDLTALLVTPRDRVAVDRTRGELRFDLEPSTLRGQLLNIFELHGNLEHGAMRLNGRLESSFGGARLAGVARPFDVTPSIELDRVSFEALDLAALLRIPGQRVELRGTLAARASGLDAGSLEADAQLDLAGSRINRLILDELTAHANIAGGRLDAGLDLRAGGDSVAIVISGEPLADPIRLRSSGSLRVDRLDEALGIDSLHAGMRLAFDVEGVLPRAGTLRDLKATAQLAGSARAKASAGEARLDSIAVVCDVERGIARVTRLVLRSNALTADGSGRIALPGAAAQDSTSFRVEGSLGTLEPLAPLLGLRDLAVTSGRFRMTATGPPGATAFAGDVFLRRPHLNEIWADSVSADFSGTFRETALASLAARIEAWSFVPWPLPSRDVDATLDWDGREWSADLRSVIEGARPQDIAVRLEPQAEGVRGSLDRFEHDSGKGTLSLQKPAAFEVGKRIHVEELVLLDDGVPVLRAGGGIEENGAVAFEVHVDSLDLALLHFMTGYPALGGAVTLHGSLTGTRERPVAEASVRARLIAGRRKPAALDGRLVWADSVLDLRLDFDQTPSHRMAFTTRLPLALTLAPARGAGGVTLAEGPMRAQLQAERFDLSWFEPLISPLVARRPRGWLNGTVVAEGNPQLPAYSGRMALSDGEVGLPKLGVRFEKGELSLGFSDRTITLERARVESGGSLEASGTATLRGPGRRTVDLELAFRRFVPMNTLQAKATLDGGLEISGKLGAPRVRGSLTLLNSAVYAEAEATTKVEAVELGPRDRLDLQERFGVGVGAGVESKRELTVIDSADVDVAVAIGDNVWVRRRSDPIVSLELKGDFRARKPPGRPLDARGSLGIRTGRSYLSFVGRRFEILSAQVGLPGPIDSASVQLEAFYSPQSRGSSSTDVEVTANVSIDATGIETNLRSEPYLDRSALLNYLATGQVQGGVNSSAAYGLAVGSALGAVGGSAGRSLGLDVVQVTMDAYGGQILSAGSYLDPRLYLGFRQSVVEGQTSGTNSSTGSNATEFEVEVEARRNLLFNLQGSSSQYRLLLRPRLGR